MTTEYLGEASGSSRSALLRRLHLNGPATRASLSLEFGLNRSTVKAIVDGLAGSALVEERVSDQGRTGVGRRSLLVSPRAQGAVVAAVDVRDDQLLVAFIGLGGQVLARARKDRAVGRIAPDEVVATVAHLVRGLSARVGVAPRWLGVSVPGLVHMPDGLVREALNLGWVDVALRTRLQSALSLETSVGNDAELGALAEHVRGAARGASTVVFLCAGVCVGGGVISGGKPLRGTASSIGELGHMVVQSPGVRCYCGRDGCWNTVVGTTALRRALGVAEEAPYEAIEAAISTPDAVVRLREYAGWFTIGLTNVVNILGPEIIVVGEPFTALPEATIAQVGAEVRQRSLVSRAGTGTAVVTSRLGREASLLGAAELAFESVLNTL